LFSTNNNENKHATTHYDDSHNRDGHVGSNPISGTNINLNTDIMKPKTLQKIKRHIRALRVMYNAIVDALDPERKQAQHTTIDVLLQNAGADDSHCVNYSHDSAVEQLLRIKGAFKAIADYSQSHLESWMYTELEMIIASLTIAEVIENEDFVGEMEIA